MLLFFVPFAALGCISAVGEEIGWRGYLWPVLRRRLSCYASAAITGVIWWLYHAILLWFGWYGFLAGIPAFTVGLVGFVLFVGVFTDRSRSVWPSVLAHGVERSRGAVLSASGGGPDSRVFTGSEYLLGEFGWLAVVSVLTTVSSPPGGTAGSEAARAILILRKQSQISKRRFPAPR